MAEIQRNSTGLSAEYFVAAELYRRGWSVGITIGNAKAIDLFAEKDDVTIPIQVKGIYSKKSSGWPMTRKQVTANCIYIFVNLNADKMGAPDYYICTSEEAFNAVDEYGKRGIVTVGTMRDSGTLGQWEKLMKYSTVAKKLVNQKK